MITLNASGGSVTFTFSGNSTYLNDGTITVPVNSLALIIDESDMISFKKANSNDIFVSANIAEFGMTKDELMAWYKENMVSSGGGGGVTPEEVEEMIDEAISGKVNTSAFTAYSGAVDTTINSKASQASVDALNGVVTAHTANTEIHVTSTEKNTWNAKANASEVMTLDKSKENELITAAALNSINERLIALETAVQTLQTLHNNE